MLSIVATVKGSPRQVRTKYGERSVLDVLMPDGSEKTVWGPGNHLPILGRRNGERITVARETNGKLHILETMSDGLASPNTSQPLPTSTSAVATAVQVKPSAPAVATAKATSPDQAMDVLVKRYASLLAKCRREVINALGIDDEDTIQKYSVTLFIQSVKALEQF